MSSLAAPCPRPYSGSDPPASASIHRVAGPVLLATRAGTDEVLHTRQRKGSANAQRGAQRFVDELIARVRRRAPAARSSSAPIRGSRGVVGEPRQQL